ncbi:hypothetical protein [Serratia marcescens]|uniref:hypothetical protein n=2 Tax=Serratia marcescens TaxID=615 RepID=UPI003988D52F
MLLMFRTSAELCCARSSMRASFGLAGDVRTMTASSSVIFANSREGNNLWEWHYNLAAQYAVVTVAERLHQIVVDHLYHRLYMRHVAGAIFRVDGHRIAADGSFIPPSHLLFSWSSRISAINRTRWHVRTPIFGY